MGLWGPTWSGLLLPLIPYFLSFSLSLLRSFHTSYIGFMLILEHAKHIAISQHLLLSGTLFLKISAWYPPSRFWHLCWNSTSSQRPIVLARISPKAEPEIKISMHVVWGTTDPKRRTQGGRRESLTDHEECSPEMSAQLRKGTYFSTQPSSPVGQRLHYRMLVPLSKWDHGCTKLVKGDKLSGAVKPLAETRDTTYRYSEQLLDDAYVNLAAVPKDEIRKMAEKI